MSDRMERLVAQYGTPMYLFDCNAFLARLEQIRKTFDPVDICYCVKANPFFVTHARHVVSRMEVCSYGEFQLCCANGVPAERIFYTGVQKAETEVLDAIRHGVRTFSCESYSQLRLLARAAQTADIAIDIFLRLGSNTQFGMDEQDIRQIVSAEHPDRLNFVGIHFFDRSQKRDVSKVRQELDWLDRFCQELRSDYGFYVQQIEYGAGLDVDYFSADPFQAEKKLLEEVLPVIQEFAQRYRLTVEMGRFFAAPCGCYLTSVVDLKRVGGVDYAIVDGGSHQMHYDGQMMGMKLPPMRVLTRVSKPEAQNGTETKWVVCGSLCTHNDIITRQFAATDLCIGDVICFFYIGAYSVTEGMMAFLTRDIPPVILWSAESEPICVRKRMNTLFLNGAVL